MSLNKKEKQVLKSLVKYHLKEVKKDKMEEDIIAILGAEAKYERTLRGLLKKLK